MKQTINSMIETLQQYKHEKSNLMYDYISERLNKSFNLYAHELTNSLVFLTHKHEKSILKRLNRIDDKSS